MYFCVIIIYIFKKILIFDFMDTLLFKTIIGLSLAVGLSHRKLLLFIICMKMHCHCGFSQKISNWKYSRKRLQWFLGQFNLAAPGLSKDILDIFGYLWLSVNSPDFALEVPPLTSRCHSSATINIFSFKGNMPVFMS